MGGLDSVMALGGAAVGLAGVVELTQALWDLGEAGASFQELSDASMALGDAFGVNARQMLNAMRTAAGGTISDANLMLTANRAIVTGITKNADTMASLLEEARAHADAFGLSSTDAFNTLVTGISNAAPRMLKQLGYTIDLAAANEEYARSIGVASDALTEQQQRQAILNAVQAQSGRIPSIDSAADSFERLDASLTNLRDALGVLFGPAIATIAQALADAANGANEIVKGASSDLAGGVSVASEQIGQLRAQIQQLNADKAVATQNDSFLGTTTDTSGIDAQIAAAEQAASAFELLKNTSNLANQAMQDGVPNAGQYVTQVNAITASAEQNRTLTTEQVAELANLNSELQGSIIELNNAAGAEAGFSNSIAATNPALDEQAGKLKALWLAAAGALGAKAAFDGYQNSVKEAGILSADLKEAAGARKAGDSVAPVEFLQADALADAKKQIEDLQKVANEPITLNVAIKGISDAAAQKAYADAIKASGDVNIATEAARNASVQVTDEVNRQVEAWQANGASITDITSFLLPSMRSQITSSKDAADELAKKFNEVKDKVSGVIAESQKLPSFKASDILSPDQLKAAGLSGDSQISVDQAANGGIQPDAINENAKRLMAIAKEGIANQPWLEEFNAKFPTFSRNSNRPPTSRARRSTSSSSLRTGCAPNCLTRG